MTEENRHTITPFIDWLIDSKLDTEPTQLYSHMEDYLKQLKASKEEVVKINIALGDVSKLLPTTDDVGKECEKQVKDWLLRVTTEERHAYRIAFRRSFEYVLRRLNAC